MPCHDEDDVTLRRHAASPRRVTTPRQVKRKLDKGAYDNATLFMEDMELM